MLSGEGPIYQQLAERVAEDILSGTYPEGAGIPSTNDYAVFYQISPITAAKAVNMLAEQGVLYKRRGVGMFVVAGAHDILMQQRRAQFVRDYIEPLVREATLLGIAAHDLHDLIEKESPHD